MKRVVIVQPYVPAYRVPLFEGLRERLLADGVDLSIVAGSPLGAQLARRDSSELAFQQTVRTFQLRLRSRSIRLKMVRQATKGADLVISELASGAIETYGLQLRRRQKNAVWGHGYAATSVSNRLDSRLERFIMRNTDRVFAYTDAGQRAAVAAGVDPSLISVLNNTVEDKALRTAIATITENEVEKFREANNLGSGPICMFIGGLDEPKRIELLLRTGEALAARISGFRLVICGDGEQQNLLNRFRSSPWLCYLGRVSEHEKALLARCGSLIMNPGRVGLIAPESFAMGTPIATTDWPYHAPEFEYLEDGVNALITIDSLAGYIAGVSDLLGDTMALARLRQGCASAALGYNMEAMIERFASGILESLASTPVEPERSPLALFVWGNWGPYHCARLRGAIEEFKENGVRAEGLELYAHSGIYQWNAVQDQLPVHRLAFPPPETRFRPWLLTVRALPLLREKRPEVIFVPSYRPWSLYLNVAARIFGARVVMMNDTHAATANSGGFRLRARRLFVRHFHAALVGGTPHVEYFGSLGLAVEKIFKGYDVVDNRYFELYASAARAKSAEVRVKLSLPERYFLSLGRLVNKKNILVLLEAYALLEPGPDGRVPALLIVGSGPEEEAIRTHCDTLALRVRRAGEPTVSLPAQGRHHLEVHFHPFTQIDETPSFYGLAEAFILPSTLEEWGLVVNEAMASGLPVLVSSAVGCAVDLVRHEGNGFTFDPQKPEELAVLLQRFVDDPGLSPLLGAASRQHVQSWGVERFGEGAWAAYKSALL